jgi:hypothetical protein
MTNKREKEREKLEELYLCVRRMPIVRVLSYFESGEIESLSDSEHREYGDRETRWQLATDFSTEDKTPKEEDGKYFIHSCA